MSSYTTTLRRLIDPEANTAGYQFVKGHYENGAWVPAAITKIEVPTGFTLWETGDKAYPLIFDDPNWEGYDPTFRSSLNSKIVDFYWGYEIGSETPSMFKQRINQKMRLIMPYYNLLFKAQWENFKQFDPNTFYKEKEYKGGTEKEYKGGTEKEYKGGTEKELGERKQYDYSGSATYGVENDGSISNEGKQYNFDTPQNMSSLNVNSPDHMSSAAVVKNNQGKVYTQNGKYNGTTMTTDPTFIADAVKDTEKYTNDRKDTEKYTNDRKDTEKYTNDRKDTEKGYNTSRYTQYKEYLEGLKNIEQMIIDELRDCFMLCY